jgi:fibronectin type 3 domain-containing protein
LRILREYELEAYKPGDNLTLIDPLVGIPMNTFPRTTLAYALKAFNKKGQDAGYSNIILTKLFPAPRPPQNLRSLENENYIEILWEAPSTNLDGSPIEAGFMFNVYRSEDPKASSGQRLTSTPVTGDSYKDETMELGRTYFYRVRSMAPPSAGGIESLDSDRVEVTNKDIYPPKPPSEVAAISNGEIISLVWSPNTEPDLAGYVVYRSGPEKKFERISDSLLTTASLVDSSVVKGQTYIYKIKAIDQKGNASEFSEEESEKVE